MNSIRLPTLKAFAIIGSLSSDGGKMSVVVAYVVLEAPSKQQLEVLVKESISKGWQPLGGVAVALGVFYQAMVGN
jgi:hypothetical protein